MPVEPSALLGRVFSCRFRVVAMGSSPRGPVAMLDVQDGSGHRERGVHELSLTELQALIESGLFSEDPGGKL
jgi:hypothetical protein